MAYVLSLVAVLVNCIIVSLEMGVYEEVVVSGIQLSGCSLLGKPLSVLKPLFG